MFVNYVVWLKDRETGKRSCFGTWAITEDIIEAAHDLMLQHTDIDYVCYRVDFKSIEDFDMRCYL